MIVGIIKEFDESTGRGVICVSDNGQEYSFSYTTGRSLVGSGDALLPVFSRSRTQPQGYSLKPCRRGDAVVFVPASGGRVRKWGYARHYLEVAERIHGTEFRP